MNISAINFIKHQNLSVAIDKLRNSKNPGHDKQETDTWFEHHETMINVLLYGALSLEAFINYYAVRYEITNVKDYERNLTTSSKWKLYPFLKTGSYINSDAVGIIKRIFTLRNKFVHPTPEKALAHQKNPTPSKSHGAQLEQLDKGQLLADINFVYKALFAIDADEASEHEKTPWLCQLHKRK